MGNYAKQKPTYNMDMTPSEERSLETAIIRMAQAARGAGLPIEFFCISRGLYGDITLMFQVPGQYTKILFIGRCGGYSRVRTSPFIYGRVKNRFVNRVRGAKALYTIIEELNNG